jgi:O-antigen/teichoic acid export membrane protein
LVLLKDTPAIAFYLYTAIGIGFNLVSNFVIAVICDKNYPYIKRKPPYTLSVSEKDAIKKNIVGAFTNKISAAANEISGNLIISSFIGVITMGVYSNYLYFVNTINTFVRIFASSISAGIGNYNAVESKENKIAFLRILHFIYTWIYGFCAVCLWVMLNPFIEVWAGTNYLLSEETVLLIVLNFFVYGLLSSISQIQQEAGIYWESKFISLISAAVCVSASLLFTIVLKWDISGVLLASIISRVCIELPYRAYVTCRYVFDEGAGLYLTMYLKSSALTFVFAFGYGGLFANAPITWMWVIVRLIICIVSINFIWFFMFRKRPEFEYLIKIIQFLINRIKNRGNFHGK